MPTYAAIPVNENTILELFSHVADVPDGKSRLAWALFRYPWVEGCDYYFIGGNYLGLNYHNFIKQILRRSELDSLFTYNEKAIERKNGPRPNGSWFAVKLRDGVIVRGNHNHTQELTDATNGR